MQAVAELHTAQSVNKVSEKKITIVSIRVNVYTVNY